MEFNCNFLKKKTNVLLKPTNNFVLLLYNAQNKDRVKFVKNSRKCLRTFNNYSEIKLK